MTLNKELHTRSYVDRLYVSRMERERRLIGYKMCVKAEENSLGQYVRYHIETLIVAARISKTIESENFTQPKELKQCDNEERLNNWRGKAMYGHQINRKRGQEQHIEVANEK